MSTKLEDYGEVLTPNEAKEVFGHLDHLSVSKKNCFLMNKRCSGYLLF